MPYRWERPRFFCYRRSLHALPGRKHIVRFPDTRSTPKPYLGGTGKTRTCICELEEGIEIARRVTLHHRPKCRHYTSAARSAQGPRRTPARRGEPSHPHRKVHAGRCSYKCLSVMSQNGGLRLGVIPCDKIYRLTRKRPLKHDFCLLF